MSTYLQHSTARANLRKRHYPTLNEYMRDLVRQHRQPLVSVPARKPCMALMCVPPTCTAIVIYGS